jgi:hypothetical protein
LKKPLPIIAAISLYSLAQILLLMSITVPILLNREPRVYMSIVSFSQLILIPGMAVVLSLCFLGRSGWWPRAWRILVLGAFAATLPVGVIGTVSGLYYVIHTPERVNLDGPDLLTGVLWILFYVALAFVLPLARKMPRRTREAASEHWLCERACGLTPQQRKRRNRAINFSLWIPSVTVLLLFMYFTETWGIISHLSQPRPKIAQYQLSIPLTWFTLGEPQLYNGSTELTGMSGRGPARAFRWYRHGYIPIFYWHLKVVPANPTAQQPYYRDLQDSVVVNRREVKVGDEMVSCVEYRPTGRSWLSFFGNPPVVDIRCSELHGLTATFFGDPSGVDDFYKMMGKIKRAN